MTTVNQGMSVEEIERVVAQRVANAIEAIAIYETKTNMARSHKPDRTNKKCKGGDCRGGHITRECRNPTAARNQRTHTCYKCGSLRHFKSKCPIVKFQKRVDKKISTLSERQAENKRKLNNTSKNNLNIKRTLRQNTGKLRCQGTGRRNSTAGQAIETLQMTLTTNNQRGTGTSQKVNCYECGNQGHYKRDCPEQKNQSHKNQTGGTRAHGVVHTLRGGETDQDPNNIKDEIEA
ncbi:reverse transcriptase domain-containing protein [Tanacetum coccineum]